MCRSALITIVTLVTVCAWCQKESGKKETKTIPYLKLSTPRHVLPTAQSWEGNEFPHTMSVLEMKRGGYRYWGWYGLNEGRGIGLARSNDLLNWTKYEQNPLWTNARWPSVLAKANPKDKGLLYFAITRDYDTPSSHIVLASSRDGFHINEEKVLVHGVPNQRNQNPNLFRDPRSGRFYLTGSWDIAPGGSVRHPLCCSKSSIPKPGSVPCPTPGRSRRRSRVVSSESVGLSR